MFKGACIKSDEGKEEDVQGDEECFKQIWQNYRRGKKNHHAQFLISNPLMTIFGKCGGFLGWYFPQNIRKG